MLTSRIVVAALSLAALALIAAGCGGSSSGASSSGSTAASSSEGSGATATVSSAEAPGLGTVLVDSEGFTVYSFARDRGAASSCYGVCAQAWPPVIAKGRPAAAEGAMPSELGTSERKDGTLQVTYGGHPLYTFVEDRSPGEANGNGSTAFGGEWNALEESGAPAVTSAGEGESSAPAESGGGSGGYGY
jgi:predicted lipoprotein with Yx(FWY)xxD motif